MPSTAQAAGDLARRLGARCHDPAGTRDGQTLRLRGKGLPGLNGGAPGDALVEIAVRPHPRSPARTTTSISSCNLASRSRAQRQGRRADPGGVRHHERAEVVQYRQRAAAQGQRRAAPGWQLRRSIVTLAVMLPAEPDADLERLISQWQSGRSDSAHPTWTPDHGAPSVSQPRASAAEVLQARIAAGWLTPSTEAGTEGGAPQFTQIDVARIVSSRTCRPTSASTMEASASSSTSSIRCMASPNARHSPVRNPRAAQGHARAPGGGCDRTMTDWARPVPEQEPRIATGIGKSRNESTPLCES